MFFCSSKYVLLIVCCRFCFYWSPVLIPQGLIGALDMGGASTEISFAASHKDNQSHYVRELLMGKKEDLYARSYLCYGYNEALSRFLAHLYSENVSVVGHMCCSGRYVTTVEPLQSGMFGGTGLIQRFP